MGGWDQFNKISSWMIKIAYLNILWIFFTIVGLGIFGAFPATAAMFAIIRNWLIGKPDPSIWKAFWKFYQQDFLKLNGFALLFYGFGYFLYYDFSFIQLNQGNFDFLYPILLFILTLYIITVLFFFPTYVHFDLSFFQYIKQSFLFAVVSPLETISIILSFVALYFVITLLPGIIPLFTGSVLGCMITWISFRAFEKVKLKKHSFLHK